MSAQDAASREYSTRRRHLMELIGPGGIAVLPAAPERTRSRDTTYEYRQDSDLFYLTGFGEPESVAVLMPGRPEGQFILFCRERDPEREIWDGVRVGPAGAVADHAADDAFPIDDIDEILPGLLERSERVYYSMGASDAFDRQLLEWMNRLQSNRQRSGAPDELVSLDHLLHEMRLFKSRAEIALMQRAARLAVAAHRRAMTVCQPGMHEYELEAEFRHEFARHASQCSYTPIVASGANACILHYTDNRAELKTGDLVLIDAGCEYRMYASDVTRTFPVNGRYSAAQRELYDIVYAAHAAAVDKVRPGNHWIDPHDAAVREVTRGLKELGILRGGSVAELIRKAAYRPYFMHKTGHWLGMDVHDVGDYKLDQQWRLLEPGMVMTVEPGIYVSPQADRAAARWRGIGIRLEDDVHLTRSGPVILSRGLPSSADEIEAFMDRVH